MEYKCGACGDVTKEPRDMSGIIRCRKCGYKIFLKKREPLAKKVIAR